MKMFIEASSIPGDMVVDCSTSTGATIHACRLLDRYVIALEEDKAIFDALLAPLIRTVETISITLAVVPTASKDADAKDVVIPRIVKKNRFSKS